MAKDESDRVHVSEKIVTNFIEAANISDFNFGEITINSSAVIINSNTTTINGSLILQNQLLHGDQVNDPSNNVHGVTGNIVGTTDIQILTNKNLLGAMNQCRSVSFRNVDIDNTPPIAGQILTSVDANNVEWRDPVFTEDVFSIQNNNSQINFDLSLVDSGNIRNLQFPNGDGIIALTTDVNPSGVFSDNLFRISNGSRQLAFDCSNISPSTTRIFTVVNTNNVLPVINGVAHGTLAIPFNINNFQDTSLRINNFANQTKGGFDVSNIPSNTTLDFSLPNKNGTFLRHRDGTYTPTLISSSGIINVSIDPARYQIFGNGSSNNAFVFGNMTFDIPSSGNIIFELSPPVTIDPAIIVSGTFIFTIPNNPSNGGIIIENIPNFRFISYSGITGTNFSLNYRVYFRTTV